MIRTSPPVKAITSTLINRSSPSLPPASNSYEPQVKSVLRYRLSRVFLLSALLCWAMASAWAWWQIGGILAAFRPTTLLGSVVLWVSSVAPVVVLRKVFLTAQRTPSTSPQSSLTAALAKSSTKPALVTYVLSALSLGVLQALTDPRLSLFVKSKKHPRYLNGRLLFLLLSQLLCAFAFLFRNLLRDRFAFRWVGMSSGRPSTLIQVVAAFFVSLISVSATVPAACLLFGIVRTIVLPILYALPGVSLLLRPFTAHFLRGSFTLLLPFSHLPLLARAWWISFCSFFVWEVAESMFDGIFTEPVSLPSASPVLLVSGVSSQDPIMKYYAYADLSCLVTDAAHRQAVFGESSGINVWGALVKNALLFLGRDYQTLLRRGAPLPAPVAPVFTPKKPPTTPFGTPTPLLRKSILRTQADKELVLDTIGSEGPLEKVVEQGAKEAHVPELFRSVSGVQRPALATSPSAKPASPSTPASPGIVQRIKMAAYQRVQSHVEKYSPGWLVQLREGVWKWWSGERKSRSVDAGWVGMREVDVVVIDLLTKLVCASLTEDKYGVVQRDIPKILEALLSFLTAVEDADQELVKASASVSKDEEREDMDRAREVLSYLNDGLKDGVARIVRTFGDKLSAFRFPPRTAAKLQGFMDFCQ